MRNYSEATVAQTEAFRSKDYYEALRWARAAQKASVGNVSYTINEDGLETVVTKHEGFNGGVPPYQPIVHNDVA